MNNELVQTQEQIDKLTNTSEGDIWLEELSELMEAYVEFEKELSKENNTNQSEDADKPKRKRTVKK